jgi:hypothetical protein
MATVSLLLLVVSLVGCALLLWRRPGEGLGLPLIAIGVFAFLYVIQPLYLMSDGTLEAFLTPAQIAKAFFLPAVTLPLFVAGWLRAAPRPAPARPPVPRPGSAHTPSAHPASAHTPVSRPASARTPSASPAPAHPAPAHPPVAHPASARTPVVHPAPASWNPQRLWSFGCLTATIGLVLYLIFISRSGGIDQAFGQAHGLGGSWKENTAYLYFGPWWSLSGIAMMLLAASRLRNELRRWVVPASFALALLVNAILLSSRGSLFATSVTILAALCLGLRLPVPFSRAVPVVAVGGLGVLLVLGFRSVLHLGESGSEAPDVASALTTAMKIEPRYVAYRMTGNEFVYHAAAIETVDETRKYHWGLFWLYIYTVHPVPRILWPDKPYTFESPGITWDDIRTVTGITISGGAAPGIVTDLYWHFGWFSLPFFYFFGKYSGRLYLRAQSLESPLAAVAYIMLIALSLNAFAQGFGAILVSFPYSIAPAVAFRVFERAAARPRRTAGFAAAHARYSS